MGLKAPAWSLSLSQQPWRWDTGRSSPDEQRTQQRFERAAGGDGSDHNPDKLCANRDPRDETGVHGRQEGHLDFSF